MPDAPWEACLTTYTKRSLRAVDLLALVLRVVGVVLALVALLGVLESKRGGTTPLPWIGAASTLALGTAPKLKVRQLVRRRGMEPEEYEGVPE